MPNADATTIRDEIKALEASYWEAMKAKDGRRTAQLSGETALVTGPRGVLAIEKEKMGAMTESGDWQLLDYAFDDVEVVSPAANVAIIAYTVRQHVTVDGSPKSMRAAESSTWVKGSDGWACFAHSETMLDDAETKDTR